MDLIVFLILAGFWIGGGLHVVRETGRTFILQDFLLILFFPLHILLLFLGKYK